MEIPRSFMHRTERIKRIVTCIEQHVVSGTTRLVCGNLALPSAFLNGLEKGSCGRVKNDRSSNDFMALVTLGAYVSQAC